MNNIDQFKNFVKKHPSFSYYIRNNSMTWQKFYELYDMYGEDSSIWNDYSGEDIDKKSTSFSDIVNLAKNIDLDKLQDGVNSLSKAFGLFSDLFTSNKNNNNNSYKPRAIFKRFDD